MAGYYALYVVTMLLSSVNTAYLYKKFQITAGTSLWADSIYLIINGVVSAVMPAALLLISGESFRFSLYSIIVAFAIVTCSALNLIAYMHAYAKGQIATVNIFGTIGTIILSCAWGLIMLNESVSAVGVIAIFIMLFSFLLISGGKSARSGKGLVWLYAAVIVLGSVISILNKQHQVETRFAAVDTLSFSVWIGIIRTVMFTAVAGVHITRFRGKTFRLSGAAVVYAVLASVLSGGCYIITLITGKVLPIVITSPLGTGIGIVMCTLLPWMIFREKLSKKQVAGVCISLVGAILFLAG